jgi:hypothetical protein
LPSGESARVIASGIAPLLVLYAFYTVLRWLIADRGPELGFDNAIRVLRLERWLHFDIELRLQTEALRSVPFVKIANWYYVAGFLPILVAAGALAAVEAPEVFLWWRRVFGVSLIAAIAGYTVYPLTPPRMLPESYGFVDTLLRYGPHYYGDATGASLFNAYGSIPSAVNVYAAMPSMHVAWSVVAAILFAAAFRYRWWAVALAVIHPLAMAFAVVVTANHYVLDILAGLLVLAISVPIATWAPWPRLATQPAEG